MVTLTLVQGVVNTFVVFFARIVGYIVDRVILKNDREVGIGFYVASFVAEMLFGVLALIIVSWFSRRREFRADAGAAQYMGSPTPMANALARLGGLVPGTLPKSFAASGISGRSAFGALFASHPPIEERIRALGGQITQGGIPAGATEAFGRSAPAASNGFGRSAR
jgi:heat shock protein HtpX